MKRLFFCLFLLSSFHIADIYAGEYTIKGQIYDPIGTYLTLIDLSDNSIVWEEKAQRENNIADFSLTIQEGNYVLYMYDPDSQRNGCKLINLSSDVDLGEIKLDEVPDYRINSGLDFELQMDTLRIVLSNPSVNQFDVYSLLLITYVSSDFRFWYDNISPKFIKTIEVDDRPIKGNFWEQINYLKNMSAENIMHMEAIPPSETAPNGILRLLTVAYVDSVAHNLAEGKVNIKGTIDYAPKAMPFLVRLSDNYIVWKGDVSNRRQFSINIEKGDYAFCVPFGSYTTNYILVEADKDVDMGIIKSDTTLKSPKGFDCGMYRRDRQRFYPEECTKEYDMLLVLNSLGLLNGYAAPRGPVISIVQIDCKPITGNLLEMVEQLRNMSAKDVDYVDVLYSSEEHPGGLIDITTTVHTEKK